MAKVFTGRVTVSFKEYIKALEEAERIRGPFREYLRGLNNEFFAFLVRKYSERTARKHCGIVYPFIDFITDYTDVMTIEEITRGMVNTHFLKWWRRKVIDNSTPDERRVSLTKFFSFLAEEKGIVCEKALKGLGVVT